MPHDVISTCPVCASELSVVGAVLPTIADCVPEWAVLLTEVLPFEVQPVRPDSNPPLVSAPPEQLVPQQMSSTA